jgi:DNA-binding NarL/FixJ family response regulator
VFLTVCSLRLLRGDLIRRSARQPKFTKGANGNIFSQKLNMTTILLVDDHEIVRKGIRGLLNSVRADWTIAGEASSGEEAISKITEINPDIVVLDVTMPGISGIETTRRVRELGLKSPIVIFTMHDSQSLAGETRKAGAQGCVRKSEAARDLVLAIETILGGGTFFPPPHEQQADAAR